MKTMKLIGLPIAVLLMMGNVFAQDDFYPSSKKRNKDVVIAPVQETVSDDEYSTATDYYAGKREDEALARYNEQMGITDSTTYYEDEEGNLRVTNNYYSGDHYDYENEYYDYEYSSRIRRFHRPYSRYGYYDDCYTNYYWYDQNPYNYGVSVYTSYGWWNPRPWRRNVGWGWNSGWYGGWSWNSGWYGGWSWGWGNNFGYYGNSYWNGYNNGFCGNYYYNSYDRNSNYYGHRGGRSGYSGYGKGSRPSGSSYASNNTAKPTIGRGKTFGEKYETAVRHNSFSTNNGSTKPRTSSISSLPGKPRTANTNLGSQPRTATSQPRTATSQPKVKPRTSTFQGGNSQPRTNTQVKPRTNNAADYNRPRTSTGGNNTYSKPRTNTNSSGYSKPRTVQGGGNKPRSTYSKPRTYNKPTTKPRTYNKPKSTNSYSRPSNSYSKPSGGNYNRGKSGGSGRSSGSSGRRPR